MFELHTLASGIRRPDIGQQSPPPPTHKHLIMHSEHGTMIANTLSPIVFSRSQEPSVPTRPALLIPSGTNPGTQLCSQQQRQPHTAQHQHSSPPDQLNHAGGSRATEAGAPHAIWPLGQVVLTTTAGAFPAASGCVVTVPLLKTVVGWGLQAGAPQGS